MPGWVAPSSFAAGYQRAGRVSAWVGAHRRPIQLTGAIVLLLVGLLMVTGVWELVITWVQARMITNFTTVL